MKKIVIIGAGLSGLYAAYRLKEKYEVSIIEARNRIGGRILTIDGFDMGPSWIWSHQDRIISLSGLLGLKLFAQYDHGHALYDTKSGVERFMPQPTSPSGRVSGGLETLCSALADHLRDVPIRLNEPVQKIEYSVERMKLTTSQGVHEADIIISTLPPRVALEQIRYLPLLNEHTVSRLSSVPTWMGHALKCVIEFKTPFWREMGLSGFCFSNIGPLMEIHDACTYDRYALFGFAGSLTSVHTFESDVREQMVRLFGDSADEILSIRWIDWRKEVYSSTSLDHRRLAAHPDYGFSLFEMDERLIFAGTESAYTEGGYLEGALCSIDQILPKLLYFTM